MSPRLFIERPILSAVVSILIVLAGLVSMVNLPVEQYPDIVPPEVRVSAIYPGANAQTIANTVAAPIEQQINGVENMLYVKSSNANGQMSMAITFEVGTDPDLATIEINNRVQAALAQLPEEVRRLGVRVQKRSAAILLVIIMSSPDGSRDPVFVSNYTLLNVLDEIKRVPGVGDAQMFGARDYAMRVWLKPDRLARFRLTPADVARAIREQNAQYAAGQIGAEPTSLDQPFTYNITTQGRLVTPEEFGDIQLRTNRDGAALRLKDVARIELGGQDYSVNASFNGDNAVGIGVFLQPGANALVVSDAIRKAMEQAAPRFPSGIAWEIPFDTTKFVRVSIKEVLKTFAEALLLVTLVVFLFLQSVRATLIPMIAVPVSIIGSLFGLYLLGYSINLLTLFAMVLSIGIVVDDAIVVLENVERIMRTQGKNSKDAAIQAMEEVTAPIVAIVLVLSAVFIPVAFLSGLTGKMYQQFAVTIAVSVLISGIVALTLTPALCAALLKHGVHGESHGFFKWFNGWFERITERYASGVRFFTRRVGVGLALFAVMIVMAWVLFARLPGALVPDEDQGYVMALPFLPAASSLDRTGKVISEMNEKFGALPAVDNMVAFTGFDFLSFTPKTSTGIVFIPLTDWSERGEPDQDARNLVGPMMGMMMGNTDAFTLVLNPPPIMGISSTGGFELYIQQRGQGDTAALAEAMNKVVQAAGQRPELAGVRGLFDVSVPQYFVDVDRSKVKALGVNIDELFATMQATFGSLYVNDFTFYGRPFRVTLQADERFRAAPEDLRHVYVRSSNGTMVPVSAVVSVKRVAGPELIERLNAFPAAKIMGSPAPGVSSGDAIKVMEEVVAQSLDERYALGWTGAAFQEIRSGSTAAASFLFGLVMVFLILAALYDRWALPLSVLSAVPFAVFGAVLAVFLRNGWGDLSFIAQMMMGASPPGTPGGAIPAQKLSNDVYFQIGMLVLIGLAAKNAILIVEFAQHKYREGMSAVDAAVAGARLRFRPIIMTSLAFILGVLPLAIASGAGSASRHSIGTGVIGGMLVVTFIGTLFIPMFYKLVMRMGGDRRGENG